MTKVNKIGSVLIIIILVTVAYVIYTISEESRSTSSEQSLKISVSEARSRRFGLIIDVRTPKEREELGYYPNSIPFVINRLNEVPFVISSKNTWILVYCNTGSRSAKAAEILYRMGYRNVRYITESYLSLMPGSS